VVSSVTASEALSRLTPAERDAVETFRVRVRELLGPRLRDLRIFGSKVRGDSHEDSDIDLLVLVDQLDTGTWTAVIDLASSLGGGWLGPIVEDFDTYHLPMNRASGFYKELRKESVRL
jgi:predicted nucleotidyltransferase